LNDLAYKGYIPIVKPRKPSPRGYGARIGDDLFNESLYGLRDVGKGVFGALTIEFGDRMKTMRKKFKETRLLLRLTVYCQKILARCGSTNEFWARPTEFRNLSSLAIAWRP